MLRFPTERQGVAGAKTAKTLVMGMSHNALAWSQTDVTGLARWHQIDLSLSAGSGSVQGLAQNPAQAQAQIKELCAAYRWVTVVLAPSLLQHWVQTPPIQTSSLNELQAISLARVQQLFGSSRFGPWVVSGEWDARVPFLCSALPQTCLEVFFGVGTKPLLVGLLSVALEKFSQLLPPTGWVAVVADRVVYLLFFQDRALLSLRRITLPALSSAHFAYVSVAAEWRREMLRSQKSTPVLHWLDLNPTPDGSDSALDEIKLIRWPHASKSSTHAHASASAIGHTDSQQACWIGQRLLAA